LGGHRWKNFILEKSARPGLQALLLAALTAALAIPFLNKAFNIDDPLFIWTAKQVSSSLCDPYGFILNWYGFKMRAWEVIQNPPLVSYYIALAGRFFGWGERALHVFFIIPACGAVLGTYFLARRAPGAAFTAGLLLLASPVFAVSASSVMCDVTMLALFIWGVFFWVKGIDGENSPCLLAASFLAGFCALTKYFGAFLIPLFIFYVFLKKRRGGAAYLLYLLIPLSMLAFYHFNTAALYGRSLLYNAAAYSFSQGGKASGVFENLLTGFSFTGGCYIVFIFLVCFLMRKKELLFSAAVSLAALAVFLFIKKPGFLLPASPGLPGFPHYLQFCLFVFGGIAILVFLSVESWRNRKDPLTLLLFTWAAGTFIFSVFFNWTVNGRSLLPCAPPLCVIASLRLGKTLAASARRRIYLLIACGILFSLILAAADYRFAGSARQAAKEIGAKRLNYPGRVFFQGHWGFQYYMEEEGFEAVDVRRTSLASGDSVVVPSNNTNTFPLSKEVFFLSGRMELPPFPGLAVMDSTAGAGFYTSLWGPLPFAFGAAADEKYDIYRFVPASGGKAV